MGDQSISLEEPVWPLGREIVRKYFAGPKGAPPAIPPIIITPFSYQSPAPAIDPRRPPPSPPVAPPARPSIS
ncbi:MAG TPA: hypothetical protein DCW29_12970 [Janthinobacterium sp.]|nr:hypothetical protein [Janthinobacterium sp.]